MKTNLIYVAAALLLAACSPKSGDTTKVVGQFAGDAPETVRLVRGYYEDLENQTFVSFFDTTIAVVDGRFEVEIPKCLTTMTELQIGNKVITFISDGSIITIDPEARTAVSSDEKGAHSQYMEFAKRWNDYQANMAGFGNDKEALIDYTKEFARNNSDNFAGLSALQMLYFSSLWDPDTAPAPEEMLALLDGLSDELKTSPVSSLIFTELSNAYNGKVLTSEGKPFVDFAVVQDPENPETSTVKLSDYVGKGKYMLVDFWASWCGPCKAEMPNLVNVYNTYHGDSFDMLSVAVGDKPEDSVAAAPEFGIVWNQIVNGQQVPTDLYGIAGIPHIILFGPDGTILKRGLRGEQIGEAVKEALGQ